MRITVGSPSPAVAKDVVASRLNVAAWRRTGTASRIAAGNTNEVPVCRSSPRVPKDEQWVRWNAFRSLVRLAHLVLDRIRAGASQCQPDLGFAGISRTVWRLRSLPVVVCDNTGTAAYPDPLIDRCRVGNTVKR